MPPLSNPVILAHAFGARYDLPIPLALFVVGGALVVVASFVLVLPRAVRDRQEGSAPDAVVHDTLSTPWAAASLLWLCLLIGCAAAGSNVVAENIVPTVFWLLVWIAAPLSCGLLGDWTQRVNPFGVLSRLADRPALRRVLIGSPTPVRWPRWLGFWPATVLYFAAACGELVVNAIATRPHVIAAFLAGYAVVCLVGGLLFGQAWLSFGELFTVLFATWGRLGYFRFGATGPRGFAGGFAARFSPAVGRVAFVLLLLISVNFDGLISTPRWSRLEQRIAPLGHTGRVESLRALSFIALTLALFAVFALFAVAAARAGRHPEGMRGALAGLLPSLVPIAFGYLLAHNIEYLLVNSQLLLPLIGNPVGRPSWPLHLPFPFNDSYEVHAHLLPSSFYWYVSVAVIIAVHVVAVVLAHRRLATRGSSERAARRSEYPWLVAMVAYTMFSLWLIAQPLVKESGGSQSGALPADTPGISRLAAVTTATPGG